MPMVRVVTPSTANSTGINAVHDELVNGFNWINLDWYVWSAVDLGIPLSTCAQNAVGQNPDVIVTAGTMATNAVAPLTDAIPIIQAIGGTLPTNPKTNVTGFIIDAKQISQMHFAKLAANHTTVTVLYDPNNAPSQDAFLALTAYKTTYFPGVQINPININQLNNIQVSFMLIPNATYHLRANRHAIAHAVAQAAVPAIYPEREFKKEHPNNRTGIMVYGHNVPATYRVAASYVDSILDGTVNVSNLPALKEAVIDKHEDL